MVAISRNSNGMLSKSKLFAKSGRNKRSYSTAPTVAPVVAETLVKTVGGAKNGGTRTIPTAKALAFYPSEDVKALKVSRKTLKPTKLRSSITPGTVLIMLAGRFRGKRVVCLKQLPGSGLLLITGPYKINGVPLRRVNACYVIATSTKVDISSVVVSRISEIMIIGGLMDSNRLMRRSTTLTSPRIRQHHETELKLNSSRLELNTLSQRRRFSQLQRPPIKRLSIRLSSLPSPKLQTSTNTSPPLSDYQRDNTHIYSNFK